MLAPEEQHLVFQGKLPQPCEELRVARDIRERDPADECSERTRGFPNLEHNVRILTQDEATFRNFRVLRSIVKHLWRPVLNEAPRACR